MSYFKESIIKPSSQERESLAEAGTVIVLENLNILEEIRTEDTSEFYVMKYIYSARSIWNS